MFFEHFKITGIAVSQIFLLSAIGFFMVRKGFLSDRGIDELNLLVMNITLPAWIFYQFIRDFSFNLFPNWWVYSLISIAITAMGLIAGLLFSGSIIKEQEKLQFLALATFQNSGYLPLALVAALFSPAASRGLFIVIFLFLAGFNLLMFSLGPYILNFHKEKKLKISTLLNAPVLATVFSLVVVVSGVRNFFPVVLLKPLRMLGDITLPLALIVVGASLARITLKDINKRAISLLVLVKMVILPLAGLVCLRILNISGMIGLLILIQLAMPSAVSIITILRAYKKEDILASQGIFITHIAAIITIPAFLILYFSRFMIK
ncbi:MAG: AEC family transporter [Candidatus Omnitrophica bacterium]|nr:AEC family transporter [Candidatus Omnitrophota bacterium]